MHIGNGKLRVVHAVNGLIGGAGTTALKLHQALHDLNVDSHMVVFDIDLAVDPFVHGAKTSLEKLAARRSRTLDRIPLKLHLRRSRTRSLWSSNFAPNLTLRQVLALEPDIVHLHWIGAGFLPIRDFLHIQRPIVWTMHDMWAFTGGCHYTGDCERFRESCGCCPVLGTTSSNDHSHVNWKRKQVSWQGLEMDLVCPSHWIAEECERSSLLSEKRRHVIYNGIDIESFRPHEKSAARAALGLPADEFLIAFGAYGAGDPRKGLPVLLDALRIFRTRIGNSKCRLIVFGQGVIDDSLFPFPTHKVGFIKDENKLALLYSASDVFCAPSQQEVFGLTAVESLACGTPVVAFKTGGLIDIIDHCCCGYLSEPFRADSLADGLSFVYSRCLSADDKSIMHRESRVRAETLFDIRSIARQHLELYRSVLVPSHEQS